MRDRNQELVFTSEDRNKVFERIHKMENHHTQKKPLTTISKQLVYFTASLLAVGLSMLLFIPPIFTGNVHHEQTGTEPNGVVTEKDGNFTALFTIKDENNRVPLNLFVTYSNDKHTMKVVSIPRDTYAPILGNDGFIYDKLTHAYAYGSEGAESVRTTVSELLDLSIDYYAVIDLKTFSTIIDSVNGIDYDIEEDIRVRAISQATFDLKKGTHRLNGEEVVALMMDATYGRSMDEKDLVNLLNAVIHKTKNEISQTQLEEIKRNIESNIPIDQLFADKTELPAIQSVSLIDGMIPVMIDETFYFKFEKEFLNDVLEELTTCN